MTVSIETRARELLCDLIALRTVNPMGRIGLSAILDAMRVIEVLEKHQQQLRADHTSRLISGPSMTITMIEGGRTRNMVPDRCQIAVDFRIVPGMNPRQAVSEIVLARELYTLTREDLRIGFESSCQYFYLPLDLVEKVINCRWLLKQFATGRSVCDAMTWSAANELPRHVLLGTKGASSCVPAFPAPPRFAVSWTVTSYG